MYNVNSIQSKNTRKPVVTSRSKTAIENVLHCTTLNFCHKLCGIKKVIKSACSSINTYKIVKH